MNMKKFSKHFIDSFGTLAVVGMRALCYLGMAALAAGLFFIFLGQQTYPLHTSTGEYEYVKYGETDHKDRPSNGFFVSSPEGVYVCAFESENIDLISYIGLSAMSAVAIIPIIIGLWFLSLVLRNIQKGRIFTDQNSCYLLYYGLIQMAAAVLVPSVKLLISVVANQFTSSVIVDQTGSLIRLEDIIPNVAFIIAAYIIRYGVNLQDEVDHTL